MPTTRKPLPCTTPPSTGFVDRYIEPTGRNTPDEIRRVRDLISRQPDTDHLAQILGIPLNQ